MRLQARRERRWSVLLVEDSAQDIFFFEHALKKTGATIDLAVCRDGDEAQRYLEARLDPEHRDLDLVLVDLNLPRVSGRELLAWIRQQSAFQTLPVLVMTTSDDPRDVAEVYRLGANCFIPKPSGMKDFIGVIEGIHQFWFGLARIP